MSNKPEHLTNIAPRTSSRTGRLTAAALAMSGLYAPSLNTDSSNPSLSLETPHTITVPGNVASSNPTNSEKKGTTIYHQPTYNQINTYFMDNNSRIEHIPSEAQNFMEANTVYLTGIGCSGTIIREGNSFNGKPVGVAFAKHCGFIPNTPPLVPWTSAKYIVGSNHEEYTLKSTMIAETGTNSDNLSPIGEIKQVIVPEDSNISSDKAFGILPGATASQVLNSYNSESLSQNEIASQLIPGKSMVYMRGWPTNQRNNIKGALLAQEFAMPYLGTITSSNDTGEILPMVITAIPKIDSKTDGAVCSFGASGAGGFIIENGQPKLVGTLSAFWGLVPLIGSVDTTIYNNKTNPLYDKAYFESLFPNVDWNNYSAVCGFSYQSYNKHKVVNVVPNLGNVPGHIQPQIEALYKEQELFVNPNYTRTIIDGSVVVNSEYTSKTGQPVNVTVGTIIRPIIDINKKTSQIFIGYYSGQQPGEITVVEVSNPKYLTFYQNNPSQPLSIKESSGEIKYIQEPLGYKTSGSLMDSTGFNYGEYVNSYYQINYLQTPYSLKIQNNKISFVKQ